MHRILFLFALCFLVSCSATKYYTDQLPDVNIPSFSTYQIESDCDDSISPINNIRVENAINLYFKERGYSRSTDPDVIVQAFLKNEIRNVNNFCNPYDRWGGGEYCNPMYLSYEEGTLIIDFIDVKKNEIFWHGAAVGETFRNAKNTNEKIPKIVNRLLSEYFNANRDNIVSLNE